jgi:UDP-glucose 4-epimerase
MIAAADSIMNTPNHDLLARYFPELPIPDGLQPYESLLSSAKAQRMLGFKPAYSWRKYVPDGSV